MAAAEQTQPRSALDVVNAYAAAKSRADADAAVAWCADDLVVETVPFQLTVRGKELNRISFAAFFDVFPDYSAQLEDTADNGSMLTGWGTLWATMQGPIGNVAATKRSCELPFVCVWAVEHGLLASERFFFDLHRMCEQLRIETSQVIRELSKAGESLASVDAQNDSEKPTDGRGMGSHRPTSRATWSEVATSDVQRFVDRFTAVWRTPEPEEFANLWTKDGTLLHPGMEEPIGQTGIVEYVRRIKQVTPDISLRPLRWAAKEDYVLIEWRATATFSGEPLSWEGADRFTLRGDRAIDGVAFFDTLPLRAHLDPSMRRTSSLEDVASATSGPA